MNKSALSILVVLLLLFLFQTVFTSPIRAHSKTCGLTDRAIAIRGEVEIAHNNWTHGGWTVDDLLREREGFGRSTTGGLGGKVYYVTSLADTGSGSLREAAESSEPLWIVFEVSGTISLKTPIRFKSDKTIDGRGAEIIITGYGFRLSGVSNIIITNLRFDTAEEPDYDAMTVYADSHDIWIHHCDFTNWSDGTADITEGSTDVTVSWCRFWNHDKTMLIGADPSHTGDVKIRVTLHHNYFFRTVQRHPRLRFGKVDAYNNYLYGWRSYGMGVVLRGELLAESNIFEAEENKKALVTTIGAEGDGYVKMVNNLLLNGASAEAIKPEKVFNRSTFYMATIEPADNALKQKIMALAGSQISAGPRIMTDAKLSGGDWNYKALFGARAAREVTIGASINFYADIPPFRRPADKIVSYEWNFGDGNTGTGMKTTHTYRTIGAHVVTLTLKDEAGNIITVSATVTVHIPMEWWILGILPALAAALVIYFAKIKKSGVKKTFRLKPTIRS